MRVKPDLHGKGYSAAQGIAIANLQSKLAASEQRAERAESERDAAAEELLKERQRVDFLLAGFEAAETKWRKQLEERGRKHGGWYIEKIANAPAEGDWWDILGDGLVILRRKAEG